MDFEWDPAKARQNYRKHGVRFEIAVLACEDPHAALLPDWASGGEERWILVGMVPAGSVLVVVHALPGEERFESFPPARLRRRKGCFMATTKHTRKVGDKPARAVSANLRSVAAIRDEDIDLSDIPELTARDFERAIENPYYRPVKKAVSARLDADVIAWLKSKGGGYQTRMNQLLRKAMLREVQGRRRG